MIQKSRMLFYRSVVSFVLMAFVASLLSPSLSFAQGMNLPVPGTMVMPSNGYTPALIRGITIEPLNPLKFDFIIDTGHSQLEGESLELESTKLIKYFLASLTVPEDELWVNLSPYEKERIASESFGRTEMGRDLLGQDYILKQLTSSLLYPESSLGKEFWKRVHDKARAKFGNVEIPVNTFNKVWIIPEDAVVYEHKNSAFVVKSRLKVMLEQDYMALKQDPKLKAAIEKSQSAQTQDINVLGSQVVREIIIPEIEKEVNEGQNFANLRQIYNSMILAAWFKNTLRESLLGQVYVDKNKVLGVDADDPQAKERIYEQYLEAYTKGVYNYIKEDIDPVTNDVIPRKYFSGGFMGDNLNARVASSTVRGPAPVLESTGTIVSVSTAVVENQRVVLPEAAASLKRNLLSLALGGLMFFSPGTSNAVTDQTAAIYANNQAAYKTNISVEQAREELDRNMTAMLGKFKTERRTATVVAPWVRQIARSAQTFDQFTAEIRKVLAAETDKNKLTVLQKNVLQALYVFVQANSVFDLAGQVFDDASVGNFRNFVVTNPQYQGRRTIICQTITELNLAFLVYELGFAVDAVTAVEVPVNFQGTDMNKTGGHSANLITFANGEKTLFDIVQGSDRNFGIGIAHRTIVVKGANGGEQIELYQRNMSQVLQGARGSTVQEFETYQSFENDFRGQYKALMTQQGTMADFIIDNKFSEALEVARQMKTQIDRLKASPELREYILQTLKKSIDDLDEIISSNILRLESKINAPAPSAQPASASAPVEQNVGGIDLNPVNLNLQVKRDGNGVPLPLINQSVREMNIEGFYPVIINITPVNNLPMLLGSNK